MTVDAGDQTAGRRSYLPGAWFGVFGEHATVLLPPSEKRRVAALWELLDDGADFDEVLDALIATGLRDLPGFVLVSDSDVEGAVTARVVVRGDARVAFETTEGPVEVVAAGAGTWVERTVPGVTSTVLDVTSPDGGDAPAEPMTVSGGLVRVSRVQSPPPAPDGGVDTDPMDLPAEDVPAGSADPADPADPAQDPAADSSQSGWSPAVVAGTAGAAGAVGAAGLLGARSDDPAHDPAAAEQAPTGDQWPYAEPPAAPAAEPTDEPVDEPTPEPAPEPAPEPLAEADPATEAFDAPFEAPQQSADPLDPASPLEHHDEPAAHEPVSTDAAVGDASGDDVGEVGEPTEMMSFDELAASSDEPRASSEEPATEGGGWEPQAPAAQDGPPAAPDFGSGAAPAGPQWTPPPAPSNPFAPAPASQDAPQEQGWGHDQGWGQDQSPQGQGQDQDQDQGQDQGWGHDPGAPDQGAPDQGWGRPEPGWGAPSGQDDVDHDGETRAGEYDPELYARQQPGIPGQPPAPSVTSRPVARLMMSHGETVDVDRAILVGRAPEARRFTATEQPRLVTVPSPNQEISSTHLEVRPGSGADHGSAVVTDMGSTNGTVLIQPGLAPEDLQPGVPVQLIPGAVIDLGDGLTIQVANP